MGIHFILRREMDKNMQLISCGGDIWIWRCVLMHAFTNTVRKKDF